MSPGACDRKESHGQWRAACYSPSYCKYAKGPHAGSKSIPTSSRGKSSTHNPLSESHMCNPCLMQFTLSQPLAHNSHLADSHSPKQHTQSPQMCNSHSQSHTLTHGLLSYTAHARSTGGAPRPCGLRAALSTARLLSPPCSDWPSCCTQGRLPRPAVRTGEGALGSGLGSISCDSAGGRCPDTLWICKHRCPLASRSLFCPPISKLAFLGK